MSVKNEATAEDIFFSCETQTFYSAGTVVVQLKNKQKIYNY